MNGPSSREVGPTSKWETQKSIDGMGEIGPRESVELKTKGGPSTRRPPDPTKIPKSSDALPATQKSPNNDEGSRRRGAQEAASDAQVGRLAVQNDAKEGGNAVNQANYFFMVMVKRVICWNCRGLGGGEFASEIKDIIREYKPKTVILLKPRINGEMATKVCQKLGKKRWVSSESVGFNGGIWVSGEEDEVKLKLKLLKVQRMFVHMEVKFGEGGWWQLTAVYANPHPSI